MAHVTSKTAGPQVSIIVPARNEEACLAECLESLVTQRGVRFEVIVVDDHSTDRTAEIARSFPDVLLVAADPLLANVCGKQNACATGARHARGSWLLFTDADTVHLAGSLARAVEEAQQHDAALLSYSPRQEVHTFWEHAIMPVVFAELAGRYRPADICNPALPAAAANGQYLLIAREAYDAVGGHDAVASTLLEDVALARLVKRSGRGIRFRYGGDAVRTRMYRSFGEMRDGWTKNLALLFDDAPQLAALRAAEFALMAGAAAVAGTAAARKQPAIAATAAVVGLAGGIAFLARIRKAHFGWRSEAVAPLGLPVFSYLLARSVIYHRLQRPIVWKGRSYAGSGN